MTIKIVKSGQQISEAGVSRRAYTLIELCLVFSVIALSGFVILPMLTSSVNDGNLRTEARIMQMNIREAQHLAQTKSVSHKVVCDTSGTFYSVQDNNSTEVIRVDLKSGINIESTTFTSAGWGVLSFDSHGAPSEGGVVTLRNAKNLTEIIHVTAGTGLTTVSP